MAYEEHLAGLDIHKVVGIALNGVPLFSGTSEFGFDVFFPKKYNSKSPISIPVDICLGNSDIT